MDLNTVRGRLLRRRGSKTNHGAKEGHCATKKGNAVSVGPVSQRCQELAESEAQRRDDLGREMVRPRSGERALRRSKKMETCSRGPTTAMSSM